MKTKIVKNKIFQTKNINNIKIFAILVLIFLYSCKIETKPNKDQSNLQKINESKLSKIEIPTLKKITTDELIEKYYNEGNDNLEKGMIIKGEMQFNQALLLIFSKNRIQNNNLIIDEKIKQIVESIYDTEDELYEAEQYSEDLGSETTNVLLSRDEDELSPDEEKSEVKLAEETVVNYNIPVVLNKRVLSMVKSYSTRLKPVIGKTLERSLLYVDRFKEIFDEEGVPNDLAYLPIIESGYRIHALSSARAKGIWQFMQGTARLEGLKVNWWVDERCDPELSTRAAARHLKRLFGIYNDWYLALAAYNAGPGKINRAIRKTKSKDYWEISKRKWVLRKETKNYVSAYLAALIIAKNPEKYGFSDLNNTEINNFDTVFLDSCTDLAVIANLTDSNISDLQKLNPHLRRLTTPPNDKKFKLNIPFGKKEKFLSEFGKLPQSERVTIRYCKIKEGQTLSQIARNYKTSVSAIKRANGISGTMIRAGKTIVIPIGEGKEIYFPKQKDFTIKKVNLKYKTGKEIVVKIRRRDTLFDLALKYRTDTKSIKKWNNLQSDFIKPGQKITLYYNKSIVEKENKKKKTIKQIPEGYHLVKHGDSLYSIARAYSVDVDRIKLWNNRKNNLIKPGELIKVCN